MVELGMAEDLLRYEYPFSFPNQFFVLKTKHETKVFIALAESLSIIPLRKN